MNKTHPRDYRTAQRCAVVFHDSLRNIAMIERAGMEPKHERQQHAKVLAILSERAAAFDGKFFKDFGKALAVLKAEGLDAFRKTTDEKRFVIRCARALYWKRFEVDPTLEQFKDFLMLCAGEKTWTQGMRDCAAVLATHDKLKSFCKGLLFAKSGKKRGDTRHRKG